MDVLKANELDSIYICESYLYVKMIHKCHYLLVIKEKSLDKELYISDVRSLFNS